MGSLVYPTTSVSPAGAGTCTYTTTGSGDLNTLTPSWGAGHGEYRNYRYTATPAAGYRFVRFDVTVDSITVDWPYSVTNQFNGTQSGDSWIYEPSAYNLENWSIYWYEVGYALWWVDPDFPQTTGEVTAISVVAVFEPAPPTTYTITTVPSPAGGGTTTGDGTYNSGATATLTATAATGYTFMRWELNGSTVSKNPTYSITVTANATYTAVFRLLTHLLVNSHSLSTPVQLVYDPTTNLLVADY